MTMNDRKELEIAGKTVIVEKDANGLNTIHSPDIKVITIGNRDIYPTAGGKFEGLPNGTNNITITIGVKIEL